MAKETIAKQTDVAKGQPTESRAPLDDAILAVMAECPYVRKTGKVGSGGYGYTFASEADFLAKLHPAMVANRLTLQPVGAKLVLHERYQTGKGAEMCRVIVRMTYRLTHATSGQSRYLTIFGEGTDAGDKAIPKAQTIALKYAMRQAFNIETGDDPDDTPADALAKAPTHPTPPTAQANGQANGGARPGGPRSLLDRLKAKDAQYADEGICEPGAMLSWAAEQFKARLGPDMKAWPESAAAEVSAWVKSFREDCLAKGAE